jgi:hypothetical protein
MEYNITELILYRDVSNDNGLRQVCPTSIKQVTQVFKDNEECAIVRPDHQCTTFAACGNTRYMFLSYFFYLYVWDFL